VFVANLVVNIVLVSNSCKSMTQTSWNMYSLLNRNQIGIFFLFVHLSVWFAADLCEKSELFSV